MKLNQSKNTNENYITTSDESKTNLEGKLPMHFIQSYHVTFTLIPLTSFYTQIH